MKILSEVSLWDWVCVLSATPLTEHRKGGHPRRLVPNRVGEGHPCRSTPENQFQASLALTSRFCPQVIPLLKEPLPTGDFKDIVNNIHQAHDLPLMDTTYNIYKQKPTG